MGEANHQVMNERRHSSALAAVAIGLAMILLLPACYIAGYIWLPDIEPAPVPGLSFRSISLNGSRTFLGRPRNLRAASPANPLLAEDFRMADIAADPKLFCLFTRTEEYFRMDTTRLRLATAE
jgi:hypothetical protein